MEQSICKIDKYELCLTQDGSPTFLDSAGLSRETMHHRAGAFSETQEIYGELVRQGMQNKMTAFLSVGLGLGYNELLIGFESVRLGMHPEQVKIKSFESEFFLRESFLRFILQDRTIGPAPLEMIEVYNRIMACFGSDTRYQEIATQQVLEFLQRIYHLGNWSLESDLGIKQLKSISTKEKYNIILYDAFSSKTCPELWGEDFLMEFLNQFCTEKAMISTYACTGALKRALKRRGFEVQVLAGFQGKRSRTFATRGI